MLGKRKRSAVATDNKATVGQTNALPRQRWRAFIAAAYQAVLGRDADKEGSEWMESRLEAGLQADELLEDLLHSGEAVRSRQASITIPAIQLDQGLAEDFAVLSQALRNHRLIGKARFEQGWQELPGYPAYNIIGQADYCQQHKRRFFELINAMAWLLTEKHQPRVLEIGASAFTNLYQQFFPSIQLDVLDRPTDEDYPGFTRARCAALNGVQAVFQEDLSRTDALIESSLPDLNNYDLILCTEVLPLLQTNPAQFLGRLMGRLAPGGQVYLSAPNFFSREHRGCLEQGLNPSPLYPPGDENWDCHHSYRHYSARELLELGALAGGETCAFYYSECLDNPDTPPPEDQRNTLVAVYRNCEQPEPPVEASQQEVILHIGSDKAGSTAIQSHVYLNRYWFRSRGIYVPEQCLGMYNGHASLMENLSEEGLQQLSAELEDSAARYSRIFMSWEGIHFFTRDQIDMLARSLHPRRIRIIYYAREQAEILQSGLLQEIKAQRKTIDLQQEAVSPHLPEARDYYQTVQRWREAIPNLDCQVVYYDRAAFPDGDVVKDLLQRLGCMNTEGFEFVRADINPSLDVIGALGVQAAQQESTLALDDRELVDTVLLYQKLHGRDTPYYLLPEQVDHIREHYKAGNHALVEELGVSDRLLTERKPVFVSGTKQFGEDSAARVSQLLEGVKKLASYRVLFGGPVRGSALKPYLGQGWREVTDLGFQLREQRAEILCRPLLQSLYPNQRWIKISLGGFSEQVEFPSVKLFLNQIECGVLHPNRTEIVLAMDKLPDDLHLLLELQVPEPGKIDYTLVSLNLVANEHG